TVSVLADNALLGGFARQQKPVDSAVVREVCRDFDLKSLPAGDVHRAPEPAQGGPVFAAVPVSTAGVPAAIRPAEAGALVSVPELSTGGFFASLARRGRSMFGKTAQ